MAATRSSSPTRNQRSIEMEGSPRGPLTTPASDSPILSISDQSEALKSKSLNRLFLPSSTVCGPCAAEVLPLLFAPPKMEILSSSSMTTSSSRR